MRLDQHLGGGGCRLDFKAEVLLEVYPCHLSHQSTVCLHLYSRRARLSVRRVSPQNGCMSGRVSTHKFGELGELLQQTCFCRNSLCSLLRSAPFGLDEKARLRTKRSQLAQIKKEGTLKSNGVGGISSIDLIIGPFVLLYMVLLLHPHLLP